MKRINIKKVVPMGTGLITTADRYAEDESKTNGIILSDKLGKIKDIQTVLFANKWANERGIKDGDLVSLSYNRYKQNRQKKDESLRDTLDEHYKNIEVVNIPTMLLDGAEVLTLDTGDVLFVISDYEYYNDEGVISSSGIEKIDNSEDKLITPKLILV